MNKPKQCRSCGGICGGGYHTAKTYRPCRATVKREPHKQTNSALALEWRLRDKLILSEALKEIYAIRGEDAEIAAIVQRALREGCVPGY